MGTEDWSYDPKNPGTKGEKSQCPPSPQPILFLFYSLQAVQPRGLLVRRAYNLKDGIEELARILRKHRGPFGWWRIVQLDEEGMSHGEWSYRITDHMIDGPVPIDSAYIQD